MIALIKILIKLIESKLVKSGIESTILNNENYYKEALKIWKAVDETFRISQSVEEKLKSKADVFEEKVLAKFPELQKSDIDDLRMAIGGEINKDKQAILDNSTILKQLQDENNSLKAQNTELQNKLIQIQNTVSITQ